MDVFLGYRTWKSRIRACVIGRESIYGGSDVVIIARTDAMAIEGYDAALERVSFPRTAQHPSVVAGRTRL